jgi:non-ribosomal peptide synthetase component F
VVLLLAIYQLAVRTWSGCGDALIAVPFAGRRGTEMAGLVGFFSCQALIRSSVSGDPTFRELLARVGASVKEAYANEGMPYGALVKIARERGDADPPMTLCMNVDPLPGDSGEPGPFRSTPVSIEACGGYRLTRFDLNLLIRQLSKTAIVGELRYAVDVLDEATARKYVRDLLALVDAATSDPAAHVSAIVRAAVDATASNDDVRAAGTAPREDALSGLPR